MSEIYRRILSYRRDMTEWLIHFTHAGDTLDAFSVLRKILREGALIPGFSPRPPSYRQTIYGPSPAVCFSEQPISAFLTYLHQRGDLNAMDGYGLVIHKHDVYAAGGLPVIYGLEGASELTKGEIGYDKNRRLLDPKYLPLREQYRYLAHAPNRDPYPMDWTHEREWRWPAHAWHVNYDGVCFLGLPYVSTGRGKFKGRVHAFVKYDEDIPVLCDSIGKAYAKNQVGQIKCSGENYPDYWRKRLEKMQVFSLQTVQRELAMGNINAARFEDMPDELLTSII